MTQRRRAAVIVAVALVIALLGALWVARNSRTPQTADDAASALWASKEPPAYSFDYSHCGGMCALCWVHVTVHHGKVTDAFGRGDNCSTSARGAPTIEDVFAMERRDRSSETTASFEIRYDSTWGFPASVRIQCPVGWADCGSSYSIANFQAQP
jgi:hypothetical protein